MVYLGQYCTEGTSLRAPGANAGEKVRQRGRWFSLLRKTTASIKVGGGVRRSRA